MKRLLQFTCLLIYGSFSSFAQLNPTISGDTMLCPEGTGLLSTQMFDSYQWYQRYYGTGTTTFILDGETSQTLSLNYYDHTASYFTVEVTQGANTELSQEFFVDGWAFLPPTVMTSGNFQTGPNGETILCEGDSAYFELMMPYDTNIIWYESGNPIDGETNMVFTATEAGSYTVSGAPSICPNWNQNLGVTLEVEVINCGPAGVGENELSDVLLFPNPVDDELTIENLSGTITGIAIHNALGQLVKTIPANHSSVSFGIEGLEKGTYFVTVNCGENAFIKTLSIR